MLYHVDHKHNIKWIITNIGLLQYYKEHKENNQGIEVYVKHNCVIDNVDPIIEHMDYVGDEDDNNANEEETNFGDEIENEENFIDDDYHVGEEDDLFEN